MSDIFDINDKVASRELVEAICNSGDGALEKVAAAASHTTRRRMREDSITPAIIPFEEINNSMLDRAVDREDPFMICEMEPNQFGAKSMNFNDTGDTAPFYLDKYLLNFSSNTTPEWTKDINLLRTYRSDVREMITDNSLRDLSRMKDHAFMKLVNDIVGSRHGVASQETGEIQNVMLPGRLTRQNWVNCIKYLNQRALLNGVFLCNFITFTEFQRWTRDEMGGDMSQELILKGNGAFQKASFGGIDFIVTLMTDLVPNGVIYQFTKPNYLGRAGVLEAPKMYVRKDKNIIRFSCRETLGCTIANMGGVQKVTFQDVANATGGDNQLPAA